MKGHKCGRGFEDVVWALLGVRGTVVGSTNGEWHEEAEETVVGCRGVE